MKRAWKASSVALKVFDTFRAVSDEALSSLAESSELREYRAGRIIIEQGNSPEWVFYVMSGVLKLTRRIRVNNVSPDSGVSEVVVQIFGPGEAIGDASIFEHFEFKGTVTTVIDSEILAIKRDVLAEFARLDQTVLLNLYNRTSKKLLKTIEGFDLSYGKLLDRIEYLAFECRNAGIDLYAHFSKAEIARMLGVSRVTVSQCLNENSGVKELGSL